ncbi:MAG: glycosyltransferase family 87 protein [Acidiphilium sp.]
MLSPKRAAALIVAIVIGLMAEALIARSTLIAHGALSLTQAMMARDFGDFWSAGHLAWAGKLQIIFHPAQFQHWLDHRFPFVRGARMWSYPPSMLPLVLPTGYLGPTAGFVVWTMLGLIALAGALALLVPRQDFGPAWLLACVLPVLWDNILVGQNAAFTGALLIAGFAWLDRRPGWAGLAFGLLTIKPQLGLLVPLAVMAAARWRAVGVAAIVALGVIGLSALAFPGSWGMFFAHVAPVMQHRLLRAYQPTSGQAYMSSAFIAARGVGFPTWAAWGVQSLVTGTAAMAMVKLWRRRDIDAAARLPRIMASIALCLAATPYTLDYDAVGGGLALAALIVTQGQSLRRDRFEIALLAIATPGWSMVLAVVFHVPVFAWIPWFILGCWEAFSPAPIHRAPAISTGRAR